MPLLLKNVNPFFNQKIHKKLSINILFLVFKKKTILFIFSLFSLKNKIKTYYPKCESNKLIFISKELIHVLAILFSFDTLHTMNISKTWQNLRMVIPFLFLFFKK